MILRVLTLVLSVSLAWIPQVSVAQELSPRATRRAVRAAVKLLVRGERGHLSTGSGSVIDARGYVLTNFHVVGNARPGHGAPSTLYSPTNEVEIWTTDSARSGARLRYRGQVVRGNIRLDLAIVRITHDEHNQPIGRNVRFPTVPLSTTNGLRPGSRLFAFGFPLGVETINVTSGEMSGFQMNSRQEVAWIRTDAEFNPGNSGGMLLDLQGRLVAVPTAVYSDRGTFEPIELARPVERIPTEWTRSLRRGALEVLPVEGIPVLPASGEFIDQGLGDGAALHRPELQYHRLPSERPLQVRVAPALQIGLMLPNGRVVRTSPPGRGEIRVDSGVPEDVTLVTIIPPRSDSGGGTLSIRYRVNSVRQESDGWHLPPPGAPGHPAGPPARGASPATP